MRSDGVTRAKRIPALLAEDLAAFLSAGGGAIAIGASVMRVPWPAVLRSAREGVCIYLLVPSPYTQGFRAKRKSLVRIN